MKKLTLQQYNTLKAIHANNPQGVSLDEFVKAACALKELEYDPSIHDEIEAKVPLQEHIKRSEASLGESGKTTHVHEYKRIETVLETRKTLVSIVCKCGSKTAIDLI